MTLISCGTDGLRRRAASEEAPVHARTTLAACSAYLVSPGGILLPIETEVKATVREMLAGLFS
jgi:hypothetical protein